MDEPTPVLSAWEPLSRLLTYVHTCVHVSTCVRGIHVGIGVVSCVSGKRESHPSEDMAEGSLQAPHPEQRPRAPRTCPSLGGVSAPPSPSAPAAMTRSPVCPPHTAPRGKVLGYGSQTQTWGPQARPQPRVGTRGPAGSLPKRLAYEAPHGLDSSAAPHLCHPGEGA